MIDNAKFHIGLVEECFEDGACGNFHILTDDNGIDSDTYKDCLRIFFGIHQIKKTPLSPTAILTLLILVVT